MNYMEALQEAREGTIRPVYLLYGGEPFLEQEILAALQERLVRPGTAAFNHHVLDPGPDQVRQAVGVAQTLPFMGEYRLVVLRDCPCFATRRGAQEEPPPEGEPEQTGGQAEALLSYLQRPSPFTCLVLQSPARELDRRRKLTLQIMAVGAAVECRPLREAEAVAWVQVRARTRAGKNMGQDACQLLVEKVGTDLYALASELEKLALFAGAGPEITLAMVDQAVAGTSQAQIFDLTDALAAGRVGAALDHLHAMLGHGDHPLRLLGAIASHYRRLMEAGALIRQGLSAQQVAQARGQKPFYWEKLMKQARRYRREQLLAALGRLLEADLALKGGSQTEESLILEMLLVDLAGGR